VDELSTRFLSQLVRLRARVLIVFVAGAFVMGWIVPPASLTDWGALLPLFATWTVLGWAASEMKSEAMKPILAAGSARRAWLAAYLVAATLAAALISFAYLFSHGIRVAMGISLLALVYGWIIGAIGLFFLLRADRPHDAMWAGGMLLLLAIFSAVSPASEVLTSGSVWHPLTPFKFCLNRTLSLTGSLSSIIWLSALKAQGLGLLLFLSLVAWRGTLRVIDRLVILP
jgi:hypothetical protein